MTIDVWTYHFTPCIRAGDNVPLMSAYSRRWQCHGRDGRDRIDSRRRTIMISVGVWARLRDSDDVVGDVMQKSLR